MGTKRKAERTRPWASFNPGSKGSLFSPGARQGANGPEQTAWDKKWRQKVTAYCDLNALHKWITFHRSGRIYALPGRCHIRPWASPVLSLLFVVLTLQRPCARWHKLPMQVGPRGFKEKLFILLLHAALPELSGKAPFSHAGSVPALLALLTHAGSNRTGGLLALWMSPFTARILLERTSMEQSSFAEADTKVCKRGLRFPAVVMADSILLGWHSREVLDGDLWGCYQMVLWAPLYAVLEGCREPRRHSHSQYSHPCLFICCHLYLLLCCLSCWAQTLSYEPQLHVILQIAFYRKIQPNKDFSPQIFLICSFGQRTPLDQAISQW